MALTLMAALHFRWVTLAFFVSESEWIWDVARMLREDNCVQDDSAAFAVMHIAGPGPVVRSIRSGR